MRGLEQVPWFYDGWMTLVEAWGLDRWRQLLLKEARGQVLEVGCGTGRNLPLYKEAGRLVALDAHIEVLSAARRRAPGVPLVLASAEALPFRPGSFDTVVSCLVFCSVPDPERGLGEVGRVLRRPGQLRMMEHVRGRGWVGRFQDWIQPAWTAITGGCRPNRDTEGMVEASGFRIERQGRRESGHLRLFTAFPDV